jgi:hypothetical protein
LLEELRRSTAVEQTRYHAAGIGTGWRWQTIRSGGEQAKRERSPDTGGEVNGNRTNRIINAQVFSPLDILSYTHYTVTSKIKPKVTMSRRSKYILRKRGKIDRLQIFLGTDVLKVAWESGS